MKTLKRIVLKYNMLLPILKKIVNKKINKIKSSVMEKIRSIKKI